jgi:Histidine kinase-, DNA gyrase B-, and HSP90-like ATPase
MPFLFILTNFYIQLLDFSKINNSMQASKSIRKQSRFTRQSVASNMYRNLLRDMARFGSSVNLDVLVEEVIGTVSAGHHRRERVATELGNVSNGHNTSTDGLRPTDNMFAADRYGDAPPGQLKSQNQHDVVVIFNIDQTVNWIYNTEPGAWRRIIMNLFSNSLKYTDRGFIKISLHAEQLPPVENKELSKVILIVEDSGRGMSQTYLQDRLYKPFAQENRLDPGTGLGLSIVQQIVSSLGGKIDLKSVKGVGTSIRVSVPLLHAAPTREKKARNDVFDLVKQQTNGLPAYFSIPGTKSSSKIEKNETEDAVYQKSMVPLVRESLARICRDWFGMDMRFESWNATESLAVYLVLETASNFYDLKEKTFLDAIPRRASTVDDHAIPLVIVLCKSVQSSYSLASSHKSPIGGSNTEQIIEYITQPYVIVSMLLHSKSSCVDFIITCLD